MFSGLNRRSRQGLFAAAAGLAALGLQPVALAQASSAPAVTAISPAPTRAVFNGINGLSSLTIQTSRAVTAPPGSVRIWDRGVERSAESFTVTPSPAGLQITFQAPITQGRLTIVLGASITDSTGLALDGESGDPYQPVFPSGDGALGGACVLQYDILAADFNRDRCVGMSDLADFLHAFFDGDPEADVNSSNVVGVQDIFDYLGAYLANLNTMLSRPDGTRPSVASLTPDPAQTLEADFSTVRATLSEPVSDLLLAAGTLHLVDEAARIFLPTSVALDADRRGITFTFTPPLPPCHRYRVGLSNAVQDLSGEPLLADAPARELTGLRPPPTPAINTGPSATAQSSIPLSGIAPAGTQVEIAGPGGLTTLAVNPVNRTFSGSVTLTANRVNALFITTISACGIRSAPAPLSVVQDTQPPSLFIDSPAQAAQIQAEATDVAGRVGDLLSGFSGLTVTVNGQPAAVNVGNVDNGTFFLPSLPLTATGSTSITVVARDALGNTATRTVNVTKLVIPPGSPRMEIVSGNGQAATVNTTLPMPVVIRMFRGDGTPFSGKLVTFNVTRSDGRLAGSPSGGGGLVFQAVTDAAGLAGVYWTLGSDAGSGNNRVEVVSRDIAGTIQLCASGLARPASQINFGDAMSLNQIGEAGAPLPVPLSVFVSDGQNGIGGTPVTFRVTRGGGSFAGQTQITLPSEPTGRAAAVFTLGAEGGENEVEATFSGNPGLPVFFSARGLVRVASAPTTFVGELYDNAGRPIGGCPVTLGVNGINATPGVTDVNGRFVISQGIVGGGAGVLMLLADQATTLAGQPIPLNSFPIMGYDVVVVPNTENSMAMAVRLPQLNPANRRTYDGTQDVVLAIEGVEGVAFKIRAGTVVRTPEGVTASAATPVTLSLDQVHFDEVPMPLPNGAAVPFAWTIQPKNTTFDPPIEVTLPNFAALPPGSVTYIQQFNHIVGGFENVGAAKVSADGSVITSDPGAGIYQAGWGGITPPPPPTGDVERYDLDVEVNGPAGMEPEPRRCQEPEPPPGGNRIQFWTNIDNESVEDDGLAVQTCLNLTNVQRDSADAVIDCSRDLEDFLQIDIAVPSQARQLAQEGYRLQVESRGLDARFFKSTSKGGDHVRSELEALQQTAGVYIPTSSILPRLYRNAVDAGDLFNVFNVFTNGDFGSNRVGLLVEFTAAGVGSISVRLIDPSGQDVACSEIDLRIFDVRDMYERAFAAPRDEDTPIRSPYDFLGSQPPLDPTNGFAFVEQSDDYRVEATQNTIVFVHGWRVSPQDYLSFSDGMFKRLWWAGYRGRFASFRWSTLYGDLPGAAATYDESEYRAFKYGRVLRDYLESFPVRFPGSRLHVAAHSMGNIVASEALKLGAAVDSYVMMQAAVPAMCYDTRPDLTYEDLAEEEDGDGQTFDPMAANPAERGYAGYFGNLLGSAGRVINFCNPVDAALYSWEFGQAVKPNYYQVSGCPFGVDYEFRRSFSEDRCRLRGSVQAFCPYDRVVSDRHEAMAMISRAVTLTVGAEPRVNRSIPSSSTNLWSLVDLQGPDFQFGRAYSDHSGQWNRPIQERVLAFYRRLLCECDMCPAQPPPEVGSRLGTGWSVSVGERSALADPSGSFQFRGVAATNQLMRVRAAGPGGYAVSEFFELEPNETERIESLTSSAGPTPSPASLRLENLPVALRPGDQAQASLTGDMSDGSSADLSSRATGTTYRSSNPLIATVDQNGNVSAIRDGVVTLMASNEGATATNQLTVRRPLLITIVQGFVIRRSDNAPVSGAVVSVLGFGDTVLTNSDGSFSLPASISAGTTSVTVVAIATISGQQWAGTLSGITPIADGVTDAGIVGVCRLGDGEWSSGLALPGLNGTVAALATYDDGSGPALFAAGSFTVAGSTVANRIAKWNGTTWSSLGTGGANGAPATVSALRVFDDGSGPRLFAAGAFTSIGGIAASRIASWDGVSWQSLASNSGEGVSGSVTSLAVFDDGSGPALYVGGSFLSAGGVPANRVARWTGRDWLPLAAGVNSSVNALHVFNDGSGPALFVGGTFTSADGVLVNRIARWRSQQWTALGEGAVSGVNGTVLALTSFDDGTGPALYVGGSFTAAGGQTANRLVRWDGAAWSLVGGPSSTGMSGSVNALLVHNDGTGPALYAGGTFTLANGAAANRVVKWNGVAWSSLGNGAGNGMGAGTVSTLLIHDDGTGTALYAGGSFTTAGGVAANRIAKWNGLAWSALGADDANGLNSTVSALRVFDDGSGPALYAGGSFTASGGVSANRVAKWNGRAWSSLGLGMANGTVSALEVFDDGTGPALYAAGSFTIADGVPVNRIAKWTGATWTPLSGGVNSSISALTVFDDGSGPALFVGGAFTLADGVTANRIAKWNGQSWSSVGSDGANGTNGTVLSLAVFNDGTGTALYAGGSFLLAGGVSVNRIAKWNGTTWQALGSDAGVGTNSTVSALIAFDDGTGPALCVGGSFTTAGGAFANRVAKWNGAEWLPLAGGFNTGGVLAVAVFNDGTGPALYAGGSFTLADGLTVNRMSQWNGAAWTSLISSTTPGVIGGNVNALQVFDVGNGPALYVGGAFSTAGDIPSQRIARWSRSLDCASPVNAPPGRSFSEPAADEYANERAERSLEPMSPIPNGGSATTERIQRRDLSSRRYAEAMRELCEVKPGVRVGEPSIRSTDIQGGARRVSSVRELSDLAVNTTAPSTCIADFNNSGPPLTSQDLYDFLDAYLAADPRADLDRSGQIDAADLSAFMTNYVAGCP